MNEALEKRAQNIKKTSPALHMHPMPEEDALLRSSVRVLCVSCECKRGGGEWCPDEEACSGNGYAPVLRRQLRSKDEGVRHTSCSFQEKRLTGLC